MITKRLKYATYLGVYELFLNTKLDIPTQINRTRGIGCESILLLSFFSEKLFKLQTGMFGHTLERIKSGPEGENSRGQTDH